VHRHADGCSERRPESETHLDELRRAPESDDEDVNPQVHEADKRLSKKLENHAAMVAIYFMYYNFARKHQTFRVTPAMEAGIADHIWSIDESSICLDKSAKS
jgi:hypothetical protein